MSEHASTATLVLGVITETHPRWASGEPILWGDVVRVPDGWRGFVTSINGPDEVAVCAYGEDDYYEEFGPDDLQLVTLGDAHEYGSQEAGS